MSPEQRFILEREALSVLGAEQCEASVLNTWGYWQVATHWAGGNSLETTIRSHLSSQGQRLVFEHYKNNNRNKIGEEPKKT